MKKSTEQPWGQPHALKYGPTRSHQHRHHYPSRVGLRAYSAGHSIYVNVVLDGRSTAEYVTYFTHSFKTAW